jgi:cytochrome-b5 reductase
MTGPKGTFFYRPNMAQQIGLIAGGTGITPMLQVKDEHIESVIYNLVLF